MMASLGRASYYFDLVSEVTPLPLWAFQIRMALRTELG